MTSLLLSSEEVADLVMTLRDAGYNVGPEQCIAAQRLMVTLAAEGRRFSDRRGLRSWLAPIFCGSPAEQADFAEHYGAWLIGRGEPVPPAEAPSSLPSPNNPPSPSPQVQISRLRRSIAALLIAAVALGAAYGLYQIHHEVITRSVRVRVVDQKNAPLPGAAVTFRGARVQPDPDGGFTLTFRLLDLPATVIADKDGDEGSYQLNTRNYQQPITAVVPLGQTAPVIVSGEIIPTRFGLTADEIAFLRKTPYFKAHPCDDPWAKLTIWQRIYRRHYRDLFVVAASFPLLVTGLWIFWMRLPRLKLIRWKSQKEIRIDALRVKGFGTEFFTSAGFRRIAQQLRRHRLVESSDLDADRTVIESVRHGGWFTPVYLWRKRLPDYLILIDRAGFRDFRGRLVEDFVKNLRLGRVEVDCYDFYSDPRLCYGNTQTASTGTARRRQGRLSLAGAGSPATAVLDRPNEPQDVRPAIRPRFSLEDLLAKHPNHNVFIFSDGAGFFSSLNGKLQPWVEQFFHWTFRAVLVPERMVADAGDRRTRILQEAGFLILSATEKGLSTAVEALDAGEVQRTDFIRSGRLHAEAPYPSLLLGDELRWLSDVAPKPSQASLLIAQLRAYLGREAFPWLCACAVYPELLWDLTLYLGDELGILGPDEQRLAMLLHLTWFRHGSMPDWLRERLVAAMPPAEREAVRQALWRLLNSALDRPLDGFDLHYAKEERAIPAPSKLRQKWIWHLLSNFIHTEPPDSALRDYVFLSVLHGRKPGKGVPIPDALRRLLGRFAEARRPIIQLVAASLATVAMSALMYRYQPAPEAASACVPPAPTGPAPYHLLLDKVVGSDVMKSISGSETLVFQATGDTGGVNNPAPQAAVAAAMVSQFQGGNLKDRPAFLYLLGNLVYYDGAAQYYYDQFYHPYQSYPGPIFAIPGNHDGMPAGGRTSLEAFVRNFCAPFARVTLEAGGVARTAMIEPNPYWTLETPFATIVGLYTNTVIGGLITSEQEAWLASEFKNAPANKALIVAMNQPVYSATTAKGSDYLGSVLDRAMLAAGRAPDLVLSAYVNNYQRFSRRLGNNGRAIAYIVSGNGGYYKLSRLSTSVKTPSEVSANVTLASFDDLRHGFLRLTVNRSTLVEEYFAVSEPAPAAISIPNLVDSVKILLQQEITPAQTTTRFKPKIPPPPAKEGQPNQQAIAMRSSSLTNQNQQVQMSPSELALAHQLSGIVVKIDSNRLTIETRNKKRVEVDATEAKRAYRYSSVITIGDAVLAAGGYDANGVLQAFFVSKAKLSPDTWPPDR